MYNDKTIFKTNAAGQVLAWDTPRGEAAKTTHDLETRIDFYIATQSLKVDDSVFIPNRETVESVLSAWDNFKSHLIVEENSYTLYNPSVQ